MLLPTTCPVCVPGGRRSAGGVRPSSGRAPSLAAPMGVESCAALLAYDGAGRELVARLKYRNARSSLPFLVRGMAAISPPGVDLVTWAPTTPERLRARGSTRPGCWPGPWPASWGFPAGRSSAGARTGPDRA